MTTKTTMMMAVLAAAAPGCSSCGKEDRPDAAAERRDAAAARPGKRAERDGGAPPSRAPLPEATLASVEGSVEVDRRERVVVTRRRPAGDGGVEAVAPDGGAAEPVVRATNDLELFIGDTVTTGADGSVEVRLPEEGSVSLGPDSMLRVSRFGVNELLLLRGRMTVSLSTPGRGRRVLKVGTPTLLSSIAGTCAVVAVSDDGATRLTATVGTAKVRVAARTEEIEVAQGKSIEVDAEGAAGRIGEAPADAAAQADGWLAGRREVVAREPAKTVRVLSKRLEADLAIIGPALDDLQTRREKNREILKRSSEARARRDPAVAAMQQELVENSRALVEATDLARSTVLRVLLREELFRAIGARAGESADLGAGATQIRALDARIAEIRTRAESQFRRFPKRPRRPRGDSHGLPKLPRLRDVTRAPPEAEESAPSGP